MFIRIKNKLIFFAVFLLFFFLTSKPICSQDATFAFPAFGGWSYQILGSPEKVVGEDSGSFTELFDFYGGVAYDGTGYVRPLDGARVEVLVIGFPDNKNAFGFYSRLRDHDSKFVLIGAEGFLSPSRLVFWKSNICCFVHFPGNYDDKKTILLSLGEKVARQIAGAAGKLEIEKMFPEEGLLSHSFFFAPGEALGLPALNGALVGVYETENEPRAVFLSESDNVDQSKEILKSLRNFFDERAVPVKEGFFRNNEDFLAGRSPNREFYFFRHGIYVVGFFPRPSEKLARSWSEQMIKNLNRREM